MTNMTKNQEAVLKRWKVDAVKRGKTVYHRILGEDLSIKVVSPAGKVIGLLLYSPNGKRKELLHPRLVGLGEKITFLKPNKKLSSNSDERRKHKKERRKDSKKEGIK